MSIERDPEGDEELWIRIYNLQAEVARLTEELSGRHPSYQSALALLFTFVCPEESFDPTQPILMGKRIKDAVARLTGELAAVRRELREEHILRVDHEHRIDELCGSVSIQDEEWNNAIHAIRSWKDRCGNEKQFREKAEAQLAAVTRELDEARENFRAMSHEENQRRKDLESARKERDSHKSARLLAEKLEKEVAEQSFTNYLQIRDERDAALARIASLEAQVVSNTLEDQRLITALQCEVDTLTQQETAWVARVKALETAGDAMATAIDEAAKEWVWTVFEVLNKWRQVRA